MNEYRLLYFHDYELELRKCIPYVKTMYGVSADEVEEKFRSKYPHCLITEISIVTQHGNRQFVTTCLRGDLTKKNKKF